MRNYHYKLIGGAILLLVQVACQVKPIEQPSSPSNPPPVATVSSSPPVRTVIQTRVPRTAEVPAEIGYTDLWDRIKSGITFTDRYLHSSIDDELELYASNQQFFDDVTMRAEPFLFWIVEEIEQRNLPIELALLPIVESSFNPDAHSSESAAGLWQFMGDTARSYGLQKDYWYDGRIDPLASTIAALNYLETLYAQFDNDWLLALAAYNAGEGTIKNAINKNRRAGKSTEFWDLPLPKETIIHVPRLLAITRLVKESPSHGIALEAIANEPYFEIVELGFQVDLSAAARAASIDPELLSSLNPGYLQWATHPDGPQFLVVPKTQVDLLKASVSATPQRQRPGLNRYEIRPGDTLSSIAREFNSSVDALMDFNGLKSSRIVAGNSLLIPGLPSNEPLLPATIATTLNSDIDELDASSYQVRPGDTLWKIARKFNLRPNEIANNNDISVNSILHPGQMLHLPQAARQANSETGAQAVQQKVNYEISSGDSLNKIAREFNVSVDDIISWNGLSRSSLIYPGQMLALFLPGN